MAVGWAENTGLTRFGRLQLTATSGIADIASDAFFDAATPTGITGSGSPAAFTIAGASASGLRSLYGAGNAATFDITGNAGSGARGMASSGTAAAFVITGADAAGLRALTGLGLPGSLSITG